LKFYASLRLDIRRIGAIKEAAVASGKDPIAVGNRTRVKVVKNKLAPPFREIEFDILYGQGISRSGDLIDLGAELGIVEKSGAWFSFGTDRIGQGRENAKAYFEQHPELMDKVEAMILAKHGIKRNSAGGAQPAPAPTATTATNGAGPERLDEKAAKKPVMSAKN
ncbi:MAG: recombinase RecA, partial [Polyangiaceae bacterium]